MKLYQTANGVYVGTQAEAKGDGQGWAPVEIPTSKPELIEWLNDNVRKAIPAVGDGNMANTDQTDVDNDVQSEIVAVKPQKTTAEPRPVADITASAISDYITDVTGNEFGLILSAVLSRLAELRQEGWQGLRDALRMHRSRNSVERGIGILLLDGGE